MKRVFKKIIIAVLTFEARLVLRHRKPKIVAVIGSVGKTSAKDAIYSVLAPYFFVRKSEKSFNSEFGVPLTVLGLSSGWSNPFIWLCNVILGAFRVVSKKPYPAILVLEVGADHPGDIRKIGAWLKPDAVVVTYFGTVPVHIEFFPSPEAVFEEKSSLIRSIKRGGVLLLNNDDERVRALADMRRDVRVITWSIKHESDFQAAHFEFVYSDIDGFKAPRGITFRVDYDGNSVPVIVNNTLGRQQVYPVLSALALGGTFGLNMVEMTKGLEMQDTPPGRMKIINGVKHSTVIDDTYNASPVAVSAALSALKEVKISGRKIAVLGDMLELGKYSGKEHEKIGREAKEAADILVTVGVRARTIAEGALDNGMDENNIFQYDTWREAAKPVEDLIKEGDIILVKGSQGARMEKVVEEIMAHPEDKEKLLARQDIEWRKR